VNIERQVHVHPAKAPPWQHPRPPAHPRSREDDFEAPPDEGVSKTREKATDLVTVGLPKGWVLVVLSDRVLEFMVRRQLVATDGHRCVDGDIEGRISILQGNAYRRTTSSTGGNSRHRDSRSNL
jgi:hypothetical protein